MSARKLWAGVALVALATTFMLEASRIFASYLVFVVDQSQRVTIGAIALLVFLSPALAALIIRFRGLTSAVWLTALVLTASRIGFQFWEQPVPRIILAGLVIAGWGWLTIGMLTGHRQAAALGLIAGLVTDLAIRIATRTVDLPWMPETPADLTTLALAGLTIAALVALGRLDGPFEPGLLGSFPVLAIGPGIALFHLVTGNPGLAQVKTDFDFPEAMLAMAGGAALGLILVSWRLGAGRFGVTLLTLVDIAAGSAGLWLFWTSSAVDSAGLILVTMTSFDLLAGALSAASAARPSARYTTIWMTAGMIAQFAILFIYYTLTGSVLLIVIAWAALAAIGLINSVFRMPSADRPAWRFRHALVPSGALVLALAAVVAWQWVTWTSPDVDAQAGNELTVMTYNIQNGFSADNRWDLRATAGAIEESDPDVVVLQEVSRGWLVMGGADQLAWLAERLDMIAAWGPASGDELWGNAILSRYPIHDQRVVRFDETQNLDRAAISVRLETGNGTVEIIGTHLDNPTGADEVRLQQVNQLLDFWSGKTPAMIFGDFNADPDDPVIESVTEAGLVDLGASLGPGASTSDSGRRIDYIFATPDVTVLDISIPSTRASDHQPVVATVRVE